MRTRFCPMIRKPAFSMRALIAPVRLRAVASGLMIEKVRSIAIVTPVAGKLHAPEDVGRLIESAAIDRNSGERCDARRVLGARHRRNGKARRVQCSSHS